MNDNITVRFLDPSEYPLIDRFFDEEGVPRLDPAWSKVVAAFDTSIGQVVGIMVLQLVAHAEPIIIDPAYRGEGIWRPMAEMMDGYAEFVCIPGLYTQPTNPAAHAICEKMGFEEREYPLFCKIYDKNIKGLMPQGG